MPVVTPLRPEDPRRVGRYRLAGRITDQIADQSRGIFLSRLPNGTPVAVMLLGATSAPDAASRDRFTAEARAARRVAPFCAARILDAGFDADQPYLVSEFIEGPSLTEVIGAEGRLDGPVLTALAIGAATGLAAIHQAGLVHGDFGPDDLILGAEGPRVVRFSITPPYGAATPSADLYSWAQTILFASGAASPDLASLPDSLRGAVSACLAEQGSRPQARALLTALLGQNDPAAGLLAEGTRRARAAGRGVVGPSQQEVEEAPPRSTARRAAFITACAACIAAIVIATTLIVTHHGPHATPAAAATDSRPSQPATVTASASPTVTPKIPAALAGTWSGTVRQTQPALAVTVQIQFTAGAPEGTITYPQLGCSGRLLLVSAAGGRYTLDQGITSGQQSCENGVVTLTPQGRSKVAFAFRRTGAPSPSGVLAKTGS